MAPAQAGAAASARGASDATDKASESSLRFARIDQVRGFAALIVVLCHLSVSAYVGAPNVGEPFLPWLGFLLGFGYLGVPLFFVVSGFCIHWPEARARHEGRIAPPGWGAFFRRRFWRLYPPYAFSVVGALLLMLLVTGAWPVSFGSLLAQLALVHVFNASTFLGVNPPSWTLAVEAQLYLAYPIVFLLMRRRGPWWALATTLVLSLAYRTLITFVVLPDAVSGPAWELFLARWFEWTVGALVAEWAAGNVRLPRVLGAWWLVAPLVPLAVYVGEYHNWHYGIWVLREPAYGVTFGLVLLAVLQLPRPVQPSRLGRWLADVGVWSYSLYLVHRPLQLALEPLARRIATSPFVIAYGIPTSLVLFAATTPLVLKLGRLFYRWCEEPFLVKARGMGRAPQPVTSA
jgi:peptidoglycan/LPS O-acetylase OafA/YrhL